MTEELSQAVQKIGEKLYSTTKEKEDIDKKQEADSVKEEVKPDDSKGNDKVEESDKPEEDKKE